MTISFGTNVTIGKRTAIVGLGLMGGSIAMALRPHLPYLSVVDTDQDTLAAAAKLADLVTTDLEDGIRGAELLILATPVRVILQILAELPSLIPEGCLLLDLGSTKVEVSQAMAELPPQFQAIGAHPMCGKELAGFSAAAADLYRSHTFILCRNGRTGNEVEEVALQIIARVGARPLFLPATVHDQLVAATSHLPYLLAAALIRVVSAGGDPRSWQVSASGFRDVTRLAGSDPKMILDILLTNRSAVLEALQLFRQEISEIQDLLTTADETELSNWITEAQIGHASYRLAKQQGLEG